MKPERSPQPNKDNQDLLKDIKVINLGIDKFYASLKDQNIEVIQVNWSPPAGGDEELLDILDSLL